MPNKGHVLVTGGTGLVGIAVTRKFLESNYSVTVLSRRPPRDGLVDPNFRWISVDLSEPFDQALKELRQVDYVVHAAASINDGKDVQSLDQLMNINVAAARKIFCWSGETGVRKVVFISSLSVLRRPLVLPISETHPVGPSTPYAMSKLWGEELLHRQALQTGFTPIVLRISSPIPPTFEELPHTVVRRWLQAAEQGEPLLVFGSGSRSQDFVSCSDVATAVVIAIESPIAKGIYHIGSGDALSMLELAQLIAKFRSSTIVLEGADSAESERWELSLELARKHFGYTPQLSGRMAIESLASQLL